MSFTLTAAELGTKTITENVPTGWSLTSVDCTGVTETAITNGVSFAVVAGATIVCTFNDSQDATVTVVKEATPEGATSFDFDGTGTGISADFDLVDDGAGPGDNDIVFTLTAAQLAGTKTITETVPSGWSLTSVSCTNVTETPITDGVSFAVAAGDAIVCTFNDSQDATVTVVKEATPEGATSFDFDATGAGIGPDIDLVDDGAGPGDNDIVFTLTAAQLAGTKTITETVPSGWSLTGVDCTGVTETAITDGVSFAVAAGDTIVCTFIDVQDATVTVVKQATPEGSTSFDFDTSGSGMPGDIDLVDDGTTANTTVITLTAGQLGTKTIVENVPAGWSLTSVSCTNVTETPITNGVSFAVAAGDTIVCTFENTKHASLTVVKETVPASDPQDFDFDLTGAGVTADLDLDTDAGNATLPSQDTFNLNAAQLGAHTVSESAVAGWSLTDLDCTGDADFTELGSTATLDIDAGETVVCTFENTKHASLTVVKETVPASDPQDFDFDLTGAGVPADLDLDTDAGNATLPSQDTFNLNAAQLGAHTVSESAVAGWSLTDLDCTGDADFTELGSTATLDIDAGETVVCTFENTKHASLTVVKETVPASDPQDFDFDLTGAGVPADLDLDTDAGNATLPSQDTFNLNAAQLGAHTVIESAVAGWSLTDLDCTGDADFTELGSTATLDIDAGETVVCTFDEHQARQPDGGQGHRPGLRSAGLRLRPDRCRCAGRPRPRHRRRQRHPAQPGHVQPERRPAGRPYRQRVGRRRLVADRSRLHR